MSSHDTRRAGALTAADRSVGTIDASRSAAGIANATNGADGYSSATSAAIVDVDAAEGGGREGVTWGMGVAGVNTSNSPEWPERPPATVSSTGELLVAPLGS